MYVKDNKQQQRVHCSYSFSMVVEANVQNAIINSEYEKAVIIGKQSKSVAAQLFSSFFLLVVDLVAECFASLYSST